MERENGELKTEVEELKKKLVTLEIRNGGKADSPDDVMFTGKVWDHLAQLLHGQMYVFVCGENLQIMSMMSNGQYPVSEGLGKGFLILTCVA